MPIMTAAKKFEEIQKVLVGITPATIHCEYLPQAQEQHPVIWLDGSSDFNSDCNPYAELESDP